MNFSETFLTKHKMIINTERLELIPLTLEQLKLWFSNIPALEKELNCSYKATPMEGPFLEIVKMQYEVTKKDPDNYLWHSFFLLVTKKDRIVVGSADFKDIPSPNGEVEIGYGLGKEFEHNGFMTESVKALCEWALQNNSVRCITAETELDGFASQKILSTCGFKKYKEEETLWWKLEKRNIIKICDRPDLKDKAAHWFHEKWNIPVEAYIESMNLCLDKKNKIPQWYLALDEDNIIAGLGVIENDFHNRKDLSPNICAVYVEEKYRCLGIAGEMLKFVCNDMSNKNINTLYLITDHTSFYEKYGWEFLCMVQGDGEPNMTRMYIHKAQ